MEEQLPSAERAWQGEKYKQHLHLNDTVAQLVWKGKKKKIMFIFFIFQFLVVLKHCIVT